MARRQARYYVDLRGRTVGPLEAGRVLDALHDGQISLDTEVCREGDTRWIAIGEVLGKEPAPPVTAAPANAPPVASGMPAAPVRSGSPPTPAPEVDDEDDLAATIVQHSGLAEQLRLAGPPSPAPVAPLAPLAPTASTASPPTAPPRPISRENLFLLLMVGFPAIVLGVLVFGSILLKRPPAQDSVTATELPDVPPATVPGHGATAGAPEGTRVVSEPVRADPALRVFRNLTWGMSESDAFASLGFRGAAARTSTLHTVGVARVSAVEVPQNECVGVHIQVAARGTDLALISQLGSAEGTAQVDSDGRAMLSGCWSPPDPGRIYYPGANLFYVTSYSGRTPAADVSVTVESLPGPRWSCGDVSYAFERYIGDNVTACTRATSPAAQDPVMVVSMAGQAVPGVAPVAAANGLCGRDGRVFRNGQCIWPEELQMLFWHGRLFGISYYPFGHFRRPRGVEAVDPDAVAAALDQRMGTGRNADTAHGGCRIPSGVPAGFIRRCRHWENPDSEVELFENSYGGRADHVVHYQSRSIRSEIDAAMRTVRDAAAAAAAARDRAAVEAMGGRL